MRARKMLTSPALLSMVSSRSASTRAISTRSAGALSRPGNTGALLSSRLAIESSLAAIGAGCEAEGERRAPTDSAKSTAATVPSASGARHRGPALEGWHLALQFRASFLVLAVAIPGGRRAFSRLQQFGRLFAVDVGDFVIETLRGGGGRGLLGNYYRRECG